MVIDVVAFLGSVVGLFAVVNPLQNLTVFRYMTRGFTDEERNAVIRYAVATGGGILLVFVLVGDLVFRLYGIGVAAFRIAGGLLILFVAFKMMWGEPIIETDEAAGDLHRERRTSLGVNPLGVPLLAGPAAIGTAMLYAGSATDLFGTAMVAAAIVVVFALVYVLLKLADRVFGILGSGGLALSSALMGLVLAAVAVQFILDGIQLALIDWGVAPPV